jgi:GGDEF domain-containing protein
MPEDSTLHTLHTTVHCYLSTLQAVADALVQACPPVGGPYRQRLTRLRARLAFDSSADAVEESCEVASRELREYAGKASLYVERHRVELRRAVAGLEDTVRTIAHRQDFYGARLRQFAAQMESAPLSPNLALNLDQRDADALAEVTALQVAGLLSCVESMTHESQSLLKRMRDEMAQVEKRLIEAEITDPVTGLMNRREMERRIEAAQAGGESPVLLLFEFSEDMPAEVAQQVAARLSSQFRPSDLISRWGERQFLVLFNGMAEIARSRAEQVQPWIAGRYLLDTGATAETVVEVRMLEDARVPELEPAG